MSNLQLDNGLAEYVTAAEHEEHAQYARTVATYHTTKAKARRARLMGEIATAMVAEEQLEVWARVLERYDADPKPGEWAVSYTYRVRNGARFKQTGGTVGVMADSYADARLRARERRGHLHDFAIVAVLYSRSLEEVVRNGRDGVVDEDGL